jgi:hypothetical protein
LRGKGIKFWWSKQSNYALDDKIVID